MPLTAISPLAAGQPLLFLLSPSFLLRIGSSAWAALGGVSVKMLLAVTPSPDDATACLDGQVRRRLGGLGQTLGASVPLAEGWSVQILLNWTPAASAAPLMWGMN